VDIPVDNVEMLKIRDKIFSVFVDKSIIICGQVPLTVDRVVNY